MCPCTNLTEAFYSMGLLLAWDVAWPSTGARGEVSALAKKRTCLRAFATSIVLPHSPLVPRTSEYTSLTSFYKSRPHSHHQHPFPYRCTLLLHLRLKNWDCCLNCCLNCHPQMLNSQILLRPMQLAQDIHLKFQHHRSPPRSHC